MYSPDGDDTLNTPSELEYASELSNELIDEIEEEPEGLTGKLRTERVNLGLAISGATLEPGERRTHREIAAFCNTSHQAIHNIEVAARKKIKKRLAELGFHDLSELLPEQPDDNQA